MKSITPLPDSAPWWRHLTAYHWFVFLIASAAWFFDCLDQRLFSLARTPALQALSADTQSVQATGKTVTAVFLIGWGIGGMIFGALGDRFGRTRMLMLTVLLYSASTGLTFFSDSVPHFTVFRFLTGLGVGGVFGLAVALVAETVPQPARTGALGMLQGLSTVGNLGAPCLKMLVDRLEAAGHLEAGEGWRWLFLVGAIPALLVLPMAKYLKEPASWLELKNNPARRNEGVFSSYSKLLKNPAWRRNLIVGSIIASTGVVGLWGIGEYATDIQSSVFKKHFELVETDPRAVRDAVESARSLAYLLQMAGGAFGMWAFTRIATRFGRKQAFAVGFAAAMIVTIFVYRKMETPADAYWMMPLMGACQLSIFAGFAIYLPELFPSDSRSTGISFCYNLGRFAAAAGGLFSAQLASFAFGGYGEPEMQRRAAIAMCAVFLAGLLVLPFAPETRGKPLPADT